MIALDFAINEGAREKKYEQCSRKRKEGREGGWSGGRRKERLWCTPLSLLWCYCCVPAHSELHSFSRSSSEVQTKFRRSSRCAFLRLLRNFIHRLPHPLCARERMNQWTTLGLKQVRNNECTPSPFMSDFHIRIHIAPFLPPPPPHPLLWVWVFVHDILVYRKVLWK